MRSWDRLFAVTAASAVGVIVAAGAARAQAPGAGAPPSTAAATPPPGASDGPARPPTEMPGPGARDAVDEAEIARALQADAAATAPGAPPAAAAPATSPAATGAGQAADAAAAPMPQARSFQSLNPDVSAIVDFAAGWFSDDDGTIKSGDDPQSTGFKVQEVELALQQVVDPYFRADIFLTIPNLSGIEVEEAFLTTTALPGNLQFKAGIFRAGLGRQNAQHLHLQDFARRPLLNAELLGTDGLRAPGFEANWLVPGLPFYLVLSASAFSVAPVEPDQRLQTFGGGARRNLSYVCTTRAFFPVSEATSLYVGLDYAHGKTAQRLSDPLAPTVIDPVGDTAHAGFDDDLFGADLYLKWKPPNQAETYASVAWQTEYFVRRIHAGFMGGVAWPVTTEGGLYSQVVVQTARRFFVGLRGELMGAPAGDNIRREVAGAASLTWALSEFARVRLYGELRRGRRFLPVDPVEPPFQADRTAGALFLQLEAAIGAHGAHPF